MIPDRSSLFGLQNNLSLAIMNDAASRPVRRFSIGIADLPDNSNYSAPVLAPTIQLVNELIAEGLLRSYAIGGSIAILFYSEPFFTRDLDIFCYMAQDSLLFRLDPIWKFLESRGCKPEKEWIIIEGVPVQFLPPTGPLEAEAMETALSIDLSGVHTRVFQLEYAMAIKVQTGRAKDWNHIELALGSAEPDIPKLEGILEKFGLLQKWRQYHDRNR